MKNLITDVPGLSVGNAADARLASGVTALIFETPATASIAILGGAPGVRDGALLEPEMTVDSVDALVLSGGSAFGLDAMGGVQSVLRAQGRGFRIGDVTVPIVPGAICFDLLNGGDKWGERPPYWDLGRTAALAARDEFELGTAGAGFGATTATLKGGLGSTSPVTTGGFIVGALVAANGIGQATIGSGPHFWAAPYERGNELGGLGWPSPLPADTLAMRVKGDLPANTTIAIVATDAELTKAQAKRLAVMAHDGMARALRPAH
ncbi:MAG: P1 family peptidase, partial [Beijerinckiaceae bacterium]